MDNKGTCLTTHNAQRSPRSPRWTLRDDRPIGPDEDGDAPKNWRDAVRYYWHASLQKPRGQQVLLPAALRVGHGLTASEERTLDEADLDDAEAALSEVLASSGSEEDEDTSARDRAPHLDRNGLPAKQQLRDIFDKIQRDAHGIPRARFIAEVPVHLPGLGSPKALAGLASMSNSHGGVWIGESSILR